ncbi:MAG: Xaa-Pro peptidase family protein [Alphaproteobacteria bacterium]|nr:Xaa-Pro peptidase family protein [Alphaproteobacteria bacterium]
MNGGPARGFSRGEFEARAERARALMTGAELDALFVTSEQHVRWFTGFDSQFWASPTRPWFLIVPREGALIAVIPEIGGPVMAKTWVEDIRTWPAPVPEDDGVSLVCDALSSLPRRFGRIGAEMGPEMVLRMPAADFLRIGETIAPLAFADGTPVMRRLRGVKSPAEIDRIRHVCRLTSDAFLALPERLSAGMTEWEACREMRIEVLRRGADSSPYMMGVAGPGGYDNIIMGPTQRVIAESDILVIDTGTTFDGYYCDFDRNFAFGEPDDAAKRAHEAVWRATRAGIDAARPGATTTDLWRAMAKVLEDAGSLGNNVGRMGHGLGLQLTEWPSNRPGDDTELVPGMVLTVEPGMEFAPGKMMIHEEDIAITEDGCELLTVRAGRELPVVE